MKKLLLLSILLISLSGCSKGGLMNSFPPYLYDLNLEVYDKDGKNMVSNIILEPNSSPNYFNTYGPPYGIKMSTPGTSFSTSAEMKHVLKTGQYQSASIRTTIFTDGEGFSNKLVHRFVYHSLFGDDKEHVIESEWELQNGGSTICKSVTFDGKLVPVVKDKNDPRQTGNLVTIQLD